MFDSFKFDINRFDSAGYQTYQRSFTDVLTLSENVVTAVATFIAETITFVSSEARSTILLRAFSSVLSLAYSVNKKSTITSEGSLSVSSSLLRSLDLTRVSTDVIFTIEKWSKTWERPISKLFRLRFTE